ncbi:hypothetical protein CDV55_101313 [Aspergillus turcosus]|nr:hypothetical protein CDV55_101313 [Aspergillus turcosus]
MVAEIRSREEFDYHIAVDNMLVVVSALAEGDGPCKDIAPLVSSLRAEHEDVYFVKFDVGKAPELALALGMMSEPTFFFFKWGKFIDLVVGADPSALEEAIKKYK